MNRTQAKQKQLLEYLRKQESCLVAFSGGVDSAVIAKGAKLALGTKAIAVTAISPSLASGEREMAERLAEQIGIEHLLIETDEIEQTAYTQNRPDRCFHCKTELYAKLSQKLPELNIKTILNGTNADDLSDFRPGLQAAADYQVLSPLADCQITKAEVRELAALWDLPVWDKPATPCLSSRIAYGEEVTPERLTMIDQAELFLKQQGCRELRVRYHRDDLARIEISPENFAQLSNPAFYPQLVSHFKQLGFRYVTLDLEGFRSGSFSALIPEESLSHQAQ